MLQDDFPRADFYREWFKDLASRENKMPFDQTQRARKSALAQNRRYGCVESQESEPTVCGKVALPNTEESSIFDRLHNLR